jgi:ElaB/YqjD/DUF883 family membrane-anchored ribosome-binding protein
VATNSALQAELRELRDQMSELQDVIAQQASRKGIDLRNKASDVAQTAAQSATRTASAVVDYARDGADGVAGVVRRHPTATSTALLTIGIIGGLIGYLVATSTPAPRDSRWSWH